jgi:hypothetical protein
VRILATILLGVTLATTISGCYVAVERRCRYGWEPEHRDERGRWVGGHCR